MKTIKLFLLAITLLSFGNFASAQRKPAAQTQTKTADAVVRDLYTQHKRDGNAILNGESRTQIDKYFDKNLADLIWKDLTTHQDEVGVIDFDLFYNTQDPDIKNLIVGAAKTAGGKATVPVTFTNSGRKETLRYSLAQEKGAWKISDIKYSSGTLLRYFKEDAANNSADNTATGNFEGAYQVGDTTCTVNPIKMAFEVKWKQGTGTEIFFFQSRDNDKYIFASDPKTGKANVFSFDDEKYTTGIFYRADGKELHIKKLK
jgi:hypothetical protein